MLHAESAFDLLAGTYDKVFSRSQTGSLQRKQVRERLEVLLKSKSSVLEISCGTGEDVLWLASQGHTVRATDISKKMIAVCNRKIEKHKLINAKAAACAFKDVDKLFPPASFDMIFSNFGGLNCAAPDEIEDLVTNLSYLLKPKGKLVVVVMGRKCIWERFYFLAKGEPQKAYRRRSREAVEADLGENVTQPTWYYTPWELSRLLRKGFKVKSVSPVGLFIPPSYLEQWFVSQPKIANFLMRMETLFAKSRLLADYGDHYMACFQKK